MLGQITYLSKSTGDVVDNLMGNTEAAKALPLSAYQGYVLDGKIAAINNNFGNIQIASLTVTTKEASAAGQPVTIANSAYTITANFDSALSVTVPIYTWGNYRVVCGDMTRNIIITPDNFEYKAELDSGLYLYKDGDGCVSLTGGWTAVTSSGYGTMQFMSDHMYLVSKINGGHMSISFKTRLDFTRYQKLMVDMEGTTKSYPDAANLGRSNVIAASDGVTTNTVHWYAGTSVATIPRSVFVVNIENLGANSLVEIHLSAMGPNANTAKIYQVWLKE